MRYVDVQQAIPAFIVYLMVIFVWGRSPLTFILVFGLFNWGGVARLVRSEVLQRRESEFVHAARNSGAGHLFIIRRHILPNVSGTVVTATTREIPLIILAEAIVSYMDLNDIILMSWGETMVKCCTHPVSALVPLGCLAATILAFSLFGDALRDVFDPRLTR